VYKVDTDGTGFATLYSFSGTAASGPGGGLVLSGNALFGATYSGGNQKFGALFKVNTDGTGFATLHSFTEVDDGAGPGGLVLSGSTLYGTAFWGGAHGCGTLFRVNTDGTAFATLYSLGGTDGSGPGGLVLSGNTLFGAAFLGGTNWSVAPETSRGTLFKINTDGTGFAIVHSFTGGSDGGNPGYGDGADPGGLVLSGDTLYGAASGGGSGGLGTLFQVNTDGTGFTTLHSFNENDAGGYDPVGLLMSGSSLYGFTSFGGVLGQGVVFSLAVAASPSNAPPQITLQPVSQSVPSGSSLSFVASASGSPPLTYQWFKDGVPVPGGTNATLTIGNVQTSDLGNYTVQVSNSIGSDSSTVASLSLVAGGVASPLTILCHPRAISARVGEHVAFSVLAVGSGTLAYQWSQNGVPLPNGTNSILDIPDVSTNGAGSYEVSVSDSVGTINSSVVPLTVQAGTGQLMVVETNFPYTPNSPVGVLDCGAQTGTIYALALQSDGKIIIAGAFCSINGVGPIGLKGIEPFGLARLNQDGSVDDTFGYQPYNPPGSFYLVTGFNAVAVQSDGKILVAPDGAGAPMASLLRLNSDGSVDPTFSPPTVQWMNGYTGLDSLALQPDGHILIGGLFDTVNGATHGSLARLNTNGTVDPTFQINLFQAPDELTGSTNGFVLSIVPLPNGSTLVGGVFQGANGAIWTNLIRLTAANAIDTTFRSHELNFYGDDATGEFAIGGISTIAVDAEGRIIVGGSVGSSVTRLAPDGSLDGSFQHPCLPSGDGCLGYMNAALPEADGHILIGGSFGFILPPSWMTGIARLNADGSLDSSYGYAGGGVGEGEVNAFCLQPDGKVLVGGSFTNINGQLRNSLARLLPDSQAGTPPTILGEPTSRTNQTGGLALLWVCAEGDAPLTYQWFKNGGALPGATNALLAINSLQSGDAGAYSVQVGNPFGSVTSAVAMLTVASNPTLPAALSVPIRTPPATPGTPGFIQLSWQDTNGGYVLETTTSLANPNWVPYVGVVSSQGATKTVNVLASDPERYFRLFPANGPATNSAVWQLSTNSCQPFDGLTLTGGTVAAGEAVAVRFFDQAGFDVTVPAQGGAMLSLTAPVYVSPASLDFASGGLSLQVLRSDGSIENVGGTLTVAEPMTPQSSPGRISAAFLRGIETMIGNEAGAVADRCANQVTYAAVSQSLLSYSNDVHAVRVLLEGALSNAAPFSFSMGSLQSASGSVSLNLDPTTLGKADRLILSFVAAVAREQGATADPSSPAAEEDLAENWHQTVSQNSAALLGTCRQISSAIETGVAIAAGAALLAGSAEFALGATTVGAVLWMGITFVAAADSMALEVGTTDNFSDATGGRDQFMLVAQYVFTQFVSKALSTASEFLQESLGLSASQRAVAGLAQDAIGAPSSIAEKLAGLLSNQSPTPTGGMDYPTSVDLGTGQVYFTPAGPPPQVSVNALSFYGKALTGPPATQTIAVSHPPDFPVWLAADSLWIVVGLPQTQLPGADGWIEDDYPVTVNTLIMVDGPASGTIVVHGPESPVLVNANISPATVAGQLTGQWQKTVQGQSQSGSLSGTLVGSLSFGSPLVLDPLLADQTTVDLALDWDHSMVSVPPTIALEFGAAQPTDLLFDLTTGQCSGTIFGGGVFTGTTDKNEFNVDWSLPVPNPDDPNPDFRLNAHFQFTVDLQ